MCLSKRLQIWYTQLPLSCCFKHCISFETHLSTLKFASTKGASKYKFFFSLHKIMMCKLVHDDIFHRDHIFIHSHNPILDIIFVKPIKISCLEKEKHKVLTKKINQLIHFLTFNPWRVKPFAT